MTIWIEALLGLSAIALCAVACWREDKLVGSGENKDKKGKWKNRDKRRSNTKT